MVSDDRCILEKHSSNAIPSSVQVLHGRETAAALLGTIFVLATAAIYFALNGWPKGMWWYNLLPQRRFGDEKSSDPPSPALLLDIPFVVLHDFVDADSNSSHRRPIHQILRSVMDNYQREGSQALTGLSMMLDEALTSEAKAFGPQQKPRKDTTLLFSTKIQRRIQRTAACLEHDERALAKLLGNFSYVLALPEKATTDTSNIVGESNTMDSTGFDKPPTENTNSSTGYRLPDAKKKRIQEEADKTHSYDSATQIWAHLVRDWTEEGKAIRHILYDWCYQQINRFCRQPSSLRTTVLVPGSGMGRLAYDLFQQGYHVEANELSPSMAAAASSVLRNQISGSFHPYVLDGMANEVNSQRRFDAVRFPDVPIQSIGSENDLGDGSACCGSLSYTVGDFVGNNDYYYRRQRIGQFDAIVTCFFIDTATNIYEYLETIRELLRPRTGVWINVGPVQWHHNALLRPSVDELKDMIEACGWKIRVWSIDTAPVSYRDENDANALPPMTSYDGYRPLRFVAIRN